MKKIYSTALALFVSMGISVQAAPYVDLTLEYDSHTVDYHAEEVYLNINGEQLNNSTLPMQPIIMEDNTLVPAREVFEALGATVEWNPENNMEVYVVYNHKSIAVYIGQTRALVGGEEKEMNIPPRIINDKTMIPLRFCAEEVGLVVDWDDETRVITISEPEQEKENEKETKEYKTVTFGSYYSDAEGKEKTPIEWIVLDEKDGKLFVVSKDVVDAHPYHDTLAEVTWDTCDLRTWLNNDFLNAAFSPEEQEAIAVTHVVTEENPRFEGMPAGEATDDKIFLLSYQETINYLPTDDDRLCKPTEYAIANDCYINVDGNAAWWLRSPGMSLAEPEHLATWGNFSLRNHYVNDTIIGDRPAMWIDSAFFKK